MKSFGLCWWWLSGKEPAGNTGVTGESGSIPGSGSSLSEGNGYPLQYSCLENPTDRGAWQATVHGVASLGHDWSNLACMHAWIFYWLGCSGSGFVFSFSTCLWVDFYDWCGIPHFTHLNYISCLIFDEGNWAVLSSALWAGYPGVNIALWETRTSRSTRKTSFEKRGNYLKLDQAKEQAKTVLLGKSCC